MRIIGKIHYVDTKNRLIGIKDYQRIKYFYLPNSLKNLFKRYLYIGIYIDLNYEDRLLVRDGISAYVVNYVNHIFSIGPFRQTHYYDSEQLANSLSNFLAGLGNMLFLDLEMTMPSYNFYGRGYRPEIIQVGYLVVDSQGKELCRYSSYIKPVINPLLSKRALNFLKIDEKAFYENAIDFKDFYLEFKEIIAMYRPTIIIYGKNDALILEKSYQIHKVNALDCRFVNLCKLIKNYYNLFNDAGLFKLYQIYYENNDLQIHDAFNDSYVTKEVFMAFKKDVEHETNFYEKIRTILEPNK